MTTDKLILVWDGFNRDHFKKHSVSVKEVIESCQNILGKFPAKNDRFLLIGKTRNSRIISMIAAVKGSKSIYIVTARDASKNEKKHIKI
jgi:uncharacterized DUF497 family protein